MTLESSEGRVVIVGAGKLAASLGETLLGLHDRKLVPQLVSELDEISWDVARPRLRMVVHAGSGRLLEDLIASCQRFEIPLVQASTGLQHQLPSVMKFAFVDAPNLALPIVQFLSLLHHAGELLQGPYDVELRESHQAAKATAAGTARVMAQALRSDPERIDSVRDPERQRELGIPSKFLDAHAAHWISIRGLGVEIAFSTKVLGHQAYGLGLAALADRIETLEAGSHLVTDLV